MAGPETRPRHPLTGGPPVPVALLLAFTGGILSALQIGVNADLGARIGSSLDAALVSFAGGMVVAGAAAAASPRTRALLRPRGRRLAADRPGDIPGVAFAPGDRAHRLPWWAYLAGLGGALLITIGAAAGPVIGIAMFTVGMVAGQVAGGLLMDGLGLGPGGRRPVTPARLAGAAVAVIAVVIVRFGVGGANVGAGTVVGLLLASAVGGVAIAGQQAVIGRLQAYTGDPILVTAVNFFVGTVALSAAAGVAALVGHGAVKSPRDWPGTPWLYFGGPIGIGLISTIALALPVLGVLRVGLLIVAGQLAGGVVLDLVSPARAGRVGPATVVGILLTLVAVAVTEVGARRPGQAARLEA